MSNQKQTKAMDAQREAMDGHKDALGGQKETISDQKQAMHAQRDAWVPCSEGCLRWSERKAMRGQKQAMLRRMP